MLEKLADADAIILGSPIYFGAVTGEMRSFIEKFMFPYLIYDPSYSPLTIIPASMTIYIQSYCLFRYPNIIEAFFTNS
ncbi:NAD(P)H-dependent oxidoreductase [Clostridium estertheticum]|nr:NAD(P)H-dependent oxidoreductase [Clostridium estertheticum]